jgi:hypothetical protein
MHNFKVSDGDEISLPQVNIKFFAKFNNEFQEFTDTYKVASDTLELDEINILKEENEIDYDEKIKSQLFQINDNEGLKAKNPNLFNVFVKYINQIGVDLSTIKIAK